MRIDGSAAKTPSTYFNKRARRGVLQFVTGTNMPPSKIFGVTIFGGNQSIDLIFLAPRWGNLSGDKIRVTDPRLTFISEYDEDATAIQFTH